MQWKELRKLPNVITLSRLILIPVLWILAVLEFRISFAILLGIAGITDWLDGLVARALKQTSEFGHWFDSFVDTILAVSLLFWLWFLMPDFLRVHLMSIGLVFGLLLLSLILGFIKYGALVDYHLYSNKISAVLLFVFVVPALLTEPNTVLFYLLVGMSIVSLIEEIGITITNKSIATYKHTIFE